jgi:hypothetical protein
MKKSKKIIGALALTLIFTFGLTNQAEAKFWGNESSEIVAYENGTICQTTTYYVFWIAVSSETTCGACC